MGFDSGKNSFLEFPSHRHGEGIASTLYYSEGASIRSTVGYRRRWISIWCRITWHGTLLYSTVPRVGGPTRRGPAIGGTRCRNAIQDLSVVNHPIRFFRDPHGKARLGTLDEPL
jgi:hypothetical protein